MKLLWLVAAAGGAGLAAGLAPPGALFLGIDLSTQSCTAVVVDARLDVVHRHSVNFDERFPEYGTESGYHAGDEGTATSPVAMWLDGLDRVLDELGSRDNVTLLPRTTANGYHDHNFVTLHERRTEHLADSAPTFGNRRQVRSRLHRVRARQVVLATGAHERPLVYANNDVPGNMLAGAVSTYIRRYGVVPGRKT